MMGRNRREAVWCWVSVLALPLAAVVGCVPRDHVFETTIHADGAVERWVYQPSLPEGPLARLGWTTIESVPRVDTDQWFGRVAEIAPSANPNENRFVRAYGRFDRVSAIPPHYRVALDSGVTRDGLQRTLLVGDFVLCKEYVFEEVVPELTTQEDAERAAREIVALAAPVLIETCREVLGASWRLEDLSRWTGEELPRMFVECVRSYYALQRRIAARRDLPRQERHRLRQQQWENLQSQLQKRFGLEVAGGDARRFLQAKLQQTVRDARGNPLDAETAAELSAVLAPPEKQPPRVARALQTVLQRRFGGKEEFDRRVQQALRRVTGVYGLAGDGTRFRFTITMPGMLLQTDGERLDERTARWSFYAVDAFPDGYSMFCRSADVDRGKASVFGEAVLTSPEDLQAFLRLCREVPPVLAWLTECVERRSSEPLRKRLRNLAPEQRDQLQRLLKL